MRIPRGVMNPVFPLLLLVLMGVSIVPFTAAAAGGVHQGGSVTDTGHGEQTIESDATPAITEVTVNESVFRTDEMAFVWADGANTTDGQVDVSVSTVAAADHEICLSSGACKQVRDVGDQQTVEFTNVSKPSDRTSVTVSLRHTRDGGTVDNATVTVWRIEPDADLDRDGVSNEREVEAGTSLVLADTDGDGLGDAREIELGTDPTAVDTDGDGLDDAREAELGTDPTAVDTDGDGLDDAREVELGTDPTAVDTDGDGLDDERELAFGANATVPDTDGDGLDDGREVALGANVTQVDTDGDGLDDAREAELGSDPAVVDTDGDGLDDAREAELGTDPTAVDTDDDGLSDARELDAGTDPTVADTDDDGLADGREAGLGTDPTVADTDDDGLDDARELEQGADPTVADTDGDYISDGTEAELGFDPTNPYTPALYGSGLVGFLLGIGVALSTIDRSPRAWARSVFRRGRGKPSPSEGSTGVSEPPAASVQAASNVGEEGDVTDASTARDVFERHQDALVTDAERTLRMLEAEGGQMKQSEIVDSTSWSKAKVSRLLSRMDDEGDVVKVSLGRENLICLPEQTPEPARQTDPGGVSSSRLVSTATGG
ncbi:hypothetical protein SAMN05216559_0554 [Halomicrobium zhouii]|uniref:DUF7343 domain-containing protein n=2 Tax=Halomicrobium zhouii TaxID=767519 RepID=A0A1I6KCJ6_9EURY|nr:hypothetical protein SAMN05216559_0554 [Halomicrobium zhouii]